MIYISRRLQTVILAGGWTLVGVLVMSAPAPAQLSPMRISDDHRSLVPTSGDPFFWMADTGWDLFRSLNREETDRYLVTRRNQGFTAIQAIITSFGPGGTNAYGQQLFSSVTPSELTPNEAYFQHIDWVVNRAEELGLHVLAFTAWKGFWMTEKYPDAIMTPTNAQKFGQFLGNRYKDRESIVWAMGGDGTPTPGTPTYANDVATTNALANGIKAGGSTQLMSYHPGGNKSSSNVGYSWIDFNMVQSGHSSPNTNAAIWNSLIGGATGDWNKTPTKPVIDAEPIYEDIQTPLSSTVENGAPKPGTENVPRATAHQVRRAAYADLFTGGFGYTYGANGVFQFTTQPSDFVIQRPRYVWQDALNFEGAQDMQLMRNLMESRPLLGRIPDQTLLTTSQPTGNENRITATRASDGSYAMIYTSGGMNFSANLNKLSGTTVRARWYNPRTGEVTAIGDFAKSSSRAFTTPSSGTDWILVLDDISKGYGIPGMVPRDQSPSIIRLADYVSGTPLGQLNMNAAVLNTASNVNWGSVQIGAATPGEAFRLMLWLNGPANEQGQLASTLEGHGIGVLDSADAAWQHLAGQYGNFNMLLEFDSAPAGTFRLNWDFFGHPGIAVDKLATSVFLAGDFNLDGGVDGADYVVWRKTMSGDQSAYDVWRANFGRTAGGGAALGGTDSAQTAIPEPATSLLALSAVVYFVVRRKTSHAQTCSRYASQSQWRI